MLLITDEKENITMYVNNEPQIVEIIGVDQLIQESHLGYINHLILNKIPVTMTLVRMRAYNPKRIPKAIKQLHKNSKDCTII